jgi:Kef-type K+ transport system membrane component KefB
MLVGAVGRSVDDLTAIVFVDIAVIVAVARIVGSLFRRIRQPAVVGEIIAGIALGPSLLGLLPGQLPTRIFPTDVRPYLGILAQLGLVIFMFIVGLEVDVALIRGKERVAGFISLSSIALPFALGVLLATVIHGSHVGSGSADAPQAHRFLPFALFIGASMSITAFPVLARILMERRMYRTEIGALALACAAVDDVVAWSLLAVVLAIIKSQGPWGVGVTMVESVAFVALMFLVVRPGLARVATRGSPSDGVLSSNLFAIVLIGLLLSSAATERIGIHQIFGAFLFGVVMPRHDTAKLFHEIVERLEQVSVLLLLPLFFIVTGFSVDLRHLGGDAVTQLPLILVVAVVGKLVGATVAARVQGLSRHKARALGVLMNTRGLTELIILNVGREFGVLDTRLFTMLVVMAVLTTVMTEPLLHWAYPDRLLRADIALAEQAAVGPADVYRVLALVGSRGGAGDTAVVDVAADLVGRSGPGSGLGLGSGPGPGPGLGLGLESGPGELVLTALSPVSRERQVGAGLAQELGQTVAAEALLGALAGRASGRGVLSVVMRSRVSEDIGADLVAQAAAVAADVVVVPDGPLAGVVVLGATTVAVVGARVDGAEGGPTVTVVVLVSEGPNGDAAVEMGARIAAARRCPLRLVPADGSRELLGLAFARAEELGTLWAARAAGTVHSSFDGPLDCEVAAGPPEAAALIVAAADIRHLVSRAGTCPVLLVRGQ